MREESFKAAIVAGSSLPRGYRQTEVFLSVFRVIKIYITGNYRSFYKKKAQRRFEDERELQRQIETDVRKIKSLLENPA